MPNTTNGLPYPAGADFVMDGENAIQALAAAVDTMYFAGPRMTLVKTTNQSIPDSGGFGSDTAVSWDSVTLSGFTDMGSGLYRYDGPPRMFAVTFSACMAAVFTGTVNRFTSGFALSRAYGFSGTSRWADTRMFPIGTSELLSFGVRQNSGAAQNLTPTDAGGGATEAFIRAIGL